MVVPVDADEGETEDVDEQRRHAILRAAWTLAVTGVFRSKAMMVMITAITPSLKASRRWVSMALPAFEAAPASVGGSLIGTVRPTRLAMCDRWALRRVAPEHDRVPGG